MVSGRAGMTSLVALATLALAATAASAATTVGQTGNTGSGCSGSGFTFLQDTVAGPPAYEAPTGGVITSWSHDAGTGTLQMRLKLYRRTANPDQYSVVRQSEPETPQPGGLRTFPTRITVSSGDLLGLSLLSGTGASACIFTTSATADRARQASGDPTVGSILSGPYNGANSRRVNVSAQLEPDADADGFGDETQDQCATDPSTQGICPVTDPPDTPPPGGEPAAKCVVPTINKGASSRVVADKLEAAGCALGDVTKKFSRKVKRGKLIKLKTRAGIELPAGAEVDAVFSKGKRKR